MKKSIVLLAFIFFIAETYLKSQVTDSTGVILSAKDTAWKAGGNVTATLSQAYFSNWAAGGEQSVALNSRVNLFAKYQMKKVLWENNLDLAYGFSNQKNTGFRKNDDLFDFTSQLGIKASEKWYYSAILNVKSQFSRGFDYSKEPVDTVSNFLSPIYMNLAVGMDYKPNDEFSAFLSPVNLKLIYVNDTFFSVRNSIQAGEHLKTEFGFIAKIKYQKNIIENVDFLTRLDIFYDYLEPKITISDGSERVKSPYISWEVLINLKIIKILTVNLNTHLIYDENFRELDADGNVKDPKLQFKEVFGLGLALKF